MAMFGIYRQNRIQLVTPGEPDELGRPGADVVVTIRARWEVGAQAVRRHFGDDVMAKGVLHLAQKPDLETQKIRLDGVDYDEALAIVPRMAFSKIVGWRIAL